MIDEREVRERIETVVRRELEQQEGLAVGYVDVQVYQRWDRRSATLEIRADLEPRR